MANKKRHSRDIDNFGFWDPPPPNMTDAEWVKWQRKQQELTRKIWLYGEIAVFVIGIICVILAYTW